MLGDLSSQDINQWRAVVGACELNIQELLEKIILETHEAILITEADFEKDKGPKILYANAAYYHYWADRRVSSLRILSTFIVI